MVTPAIQNVPLVEPALAQKSDTESAFHGTPSIVALIVEVTADDGVGVGVDVGVVGEMLEDVFDELLPQPEIKRNKRTASEKRCTAHQPGVDVRRTPQH